jgi:hypothetical protein
MVGITMIAGREIWKRRRGRSLPREIKIMIRREAGRAKVARRIHLEEGGSTRAVEIGTGVAAGATMIAAMMRMNAEERVVKRGRRGKITVRAAAAAESILLITRKADGEIEALAVTAHPQALLPTAAALQATAITIIVGRRKQKSNRHHRQQ